MDLNKNIGQQIKNRLNQEQVHAPDELWDQIEQKLINKRKRTLAFIFSFSMIAIIAVLAGYTSLKKSSSETIELNETEQKLGTEISEEKTKKQNIPLANEDKTIEKKRFEKTKTKTEYNINQQNTKLKTSIVVINQDHISKSKHAKQIHNKTNLTKHKNTVNNKSNYLTTNSKTGKKEQYFIGNKKDDVIYSKKPITELNSPTRPITIDLTLIKTSLEKILKNKITGLNTPKKKPKENSNFKTSVSTIAFPVYFNQFGKTSPLDPSLNSAKKNQAIHFNYGVYINFTNNTNWGLRFGVLKTRLQNTVSRNFNLTNEIPTNSSNLKELSANTENISNAEIVSNKENGTFNLSNRLEYLEFPLEVTYSQNKKKFSPQFISGLSFLYLTKNTVYGSSNTVNKFVIGKSDNIFKVNVSLNIGAGFNYRINDKLKVQSHLLLKYHLFFYKRDDNYHPYSLGLQTGLLYTF